MEIEPLRLWSIHPKYLDTVGLVALWREALLAQKVLKGETEGYKSHPQLERFKRHPHPRKAIADYLLRVWEESKKRGFSFDKRRIGRRRGARRLMVTRGQLEYELGLLSGKLIKRSTIKFPEQASHGEVQPHPFFKVINGEIESWERIQGDAKP
jgi:hypothetical protein